MLSIKDQFEQISWQKVDKVAPVLLFVFILALCWKMAAMFWWIVAPPQVMQLEQVSLGSQQAQVPNITAFSLFYEAGASAANTEESVPMTLQGVIVGYPNRYSSAVIKVNDNADRIVVGQNIEGTSYQLAAVYWDHVILKQNSGATRELKFKGIDNLNQEIIPTANNIAPSHASVAPSSPPANAEQNVLNQAIQRMEEDREQYMKNMGVNASNGNGYEITDQTPAALRNKLGLRSGDRILSLNGQTVGQGKTDVQLLEQAKREGKVRIEIKRGDQVMTIQQSL